MLLGANYLFVSYCNQETSTVHLTNSIECLSFRHGSAYSIGIEYLPFSSVGLCGHLVDCRGACQQLKVIFLWCVGVDYMIYHTRSTNRKQTHNSVGSYNFAESSRSVILTRMNANLQILQLYICLSVYSSSYIIVLVCYQTFMWLL